jgi:hypothetical protein
MIFLLHVLVVLLALSGLGAVLLLVYVIHLSRQHNARDNTFDPWA